MQHQEVANVDIFAHGQLVVALDLRLVESPAREPASSAGRCRSGPDGCAVDSSGSRKPPARPIDDDVLLPRSRAVTGREAQRSGIAERLAVEICEQSATASSSLMCASSNRRGRCRCGAAAGCAIATRRAARSSASAARRSPASVQRNRDRSVARQPLAPVVERPPSSCPISSAAKARAVDEQLALDLRCPLFEHDGGDEAALAVALDVDDPALGAPDAPAVRPAARKISRVQRPASNWKA